MDVLSNIHSLHELWSGELIAMEYLKGKHIFAAQRIFSAKKCDIQAALITLLFTIDGEPITIEGIDEMPGYIVSTMLEMLGTQLPPTNEVCYR